MRVPNQHRVRQGAYRSSEADGNNGAFFVPSTRRDARVPFKVLASDGEGWEHVSVSFPDRCPTWEEMCVIKSLFWDDEDCVMQLHPPKSDWVNNHPYCLHLWRPTLAEIPRPPSLMVGYKNIGRIA